MTQLSNPFMHFNIIKDYRQSGKVNHELSDIILLTICGVLLGHDTWEGISDFGETRLDFLSAYGDFADGIPSADTIARVMGMISTKALQKAFIDWMLDCHDLTEGQVIAFDGKTVRALIINLAGNQLSIWLMSLQQQGNRMNILAMTGCKRI